MTIGNLSQFLNLNPDIRFCTSKHLDCNETVIPRIFGLISADQSVAELEALMGRENETHMHYFSAKLLDDDERGAGFKRMTDSIANAFCNWHGWLCNTRRI